MSYSLRVRGYSDDNLDDNPSFENEQSFILAESILKSDSRRLDVLVGEFLLNREVSYTFHETVLRYVEVDEGCTVKTSDDGGVHYFDKGWFLLSKEAESKRTQLRFHFAVEEASIALGKLN